MGTRITERVVRAADVGSRKYVIFDEDCAGFGLCAFALLAAAPVTALLGCVLPPYTFPTLCAEAVQRCLAPADAAEWRARVATLKSERARLSSALARVPGIRRVWPSDANFVLVEAVDAPALVAAARAGGILLRDFSWDPALPGCVRITVGDPAENDQLLQVLGQA